MPPRGIIVDGLWHCLCPSFNPTTFKNAAILSATLRQTQPARAVKTASVYSRPALARRSYSTNDKKDEGKLETSKLESSKNSLTQDAQGLKTEEQAKEETQNEAPPELKFKRVTARKPLRTTFGVPKDLEQRSTGNLENLLQDSVSKSPSVHSATQILRILIRDRHVRPEVRHYRALILANTDARYGSPENVRNLLKEMESSGIPADSGTLHAALQVRFHPFRILLIAESY